MRLGAKVIKDKITQDIKTEISSLAGTPAFLVITIGEDMASNVYVSNKKKYAKEVGITALHEVLENEVSTLEVIKVINEYNNNNDVHGILVQLPIPEHLDTDLIIEAINPQKDIDGFTHTNIAKLFLGEDNLNPCTVEGILDILNYYNIKYSGKNVCIVGRSNIVGKPLALKLINEGSTVTSCNSRTKDIKEHSLKADIFISAIGVAKKFDKSYFKESCFVIDVGMNRDSNGKLCGDVDYQDVEPFVSGITPVPGGVGLMTVNNVIRNTLKAYKNQGGK